jgi:hypothetical protein
MRAYERRPLGIQVTLAREVKDDLLNYSILSDRAAVLGLKKPTIELRAEHYFGLVTILPVVST